MSLTKKELFVARQKEFVKLLENKKKHGGGDINFDIRENFGAYLRYARLITQKFGVKLQIAGNSFCTDGNMINIPMMHEVPDFRALMGVLLHECSHILWTKFNAMRSCTNFIQLTIINALEDIRIERRAERIYAGARDLFLTSYNTMKLASYDNDWGRRSKDWQEKHGNKQQIELDPGIKLFLERFMAFLIQFIVYKRSYHTERPKDDQLLGIFDEVLNTYSNEFPVNTYKVVEAATKIINKMYVAGILSNIFDIDAIVFEMNEEIAMSDKFDVDNVPDIDPDTLDASMNHDPIQELIELLEKRVQDETVQENKDLCQRLLNALTDRSVGKKDQANEIQNKDTKQNGVKPPQLSLLDELKAILSNNELSLQKRTILEELLKNLQSKQGRSLSNELPTNQQKVGQNDGMISGQSGKEFPVMRRKNEAADIRELSRQRKEFDEFQNTNEDYKSVLEAWKQIRKTLDEKNAKYKPIISELKQKNAQARDEMREHAQKRGECSSQIESLKKLSMQWRDEISQHKFNGDNDIAGELQSRYDAVQEQIKYFSRLRRVIIPLTTKARKVAEETAQRLSDVMSELNSTIDEPSKEFAILDKEKKTLEQPYMRQIKSAKQELVKAENFNQDNQSFFQQEMDEIADDWVNDVWEIFRSNDCGDDFLEWTNTKPELLAIINRSKKFSKKRYIPFSTARDTVIHFATSPMTRSLCKAQQKKYQTIINKIYEEMIKIHAPTKLSFYSGKERGYIDTKAVWKLATAPYRHQGGEPIKIFKEPWLKKKPNVTVMLLIDCSGSMRVNLEQTQAAVVVLSGVLDKMNIRHEVLGYSTNTGRAFINVVPDKFSRWVPINNYIFRDLNSTDSSAIFTSDQRLLMHDGLDGESLRWAAGRLLGQHVRRKKLLIYLTDSQPSCSRGEDVLAPPFGHESEIRKDLYLACKQIEHATAIELWGIGIRTNAASDFFANNKRIDDVKQLPTVMASIVSNFIKEKGLF